MIVIKSLVNTLNILLCLVAIAAWLRRTGRVRFGNGVLLGCAAAFLLASTRAVPEALIYRFESQYGVFQHSKMASIKDSAVYIHVLGAGYSADGRLPASARLAPRTLGRLAEGMRIANMVSGSVLVCSGAIRSGEQSQAEVVRQAAVGLGFDSTMTLTLNTPDTTAEEAEALRDSVGTGIALVLVTDAVHMPRAITIFKNRGFKPIPAPTNFVIKKGPTAHWMRWSPSAESLLLSDRVLHEVLGYAKEILVNAKSAFSNL